ncbi:unnamed protein product, partial [Discosporangium mesarthrocarpum]
STGKYFEVTVVKGAPKPVIGVGLADPHRFPTPGQFLGWVRHSYACHGDDGVLSGDRKAGVT